jgi:hypothetical protein
MAAQRRVREPALDSAPVRERSPDWLIFGARPALSLGGIHDRVHREQRELA